MLKTIYLLSVWLHLVAASLWIGGLLFVGLILVPLIRRPSLQGRAADLVHEAGTLFRNVGWIGFAVLTATGLFNVAYRHGGLGVLGDPRFWQNAWGRTLALKLALFACVLVLGAVHDFFVGPAATRRWREAPGAPATLRLRRLAGWMGRVNVLLSLAILYLAVRLVRG